MRKLLTLLFIFLLMLGLFAGYLYLTDKITAGSLKIATGEKQIEEGEKELAKGKAKLSNGERNLSQAKSGYKSIKTISYLSAVVMPFAGGVLTVASSQAIGNKISEGNQLVARGQQKIKAGQSQLSEGKKELSMGKERLKKAEKIRIVCGVGAIICAVLLIVLGFCW